MKRTTSSIDYLSDVELFRPNEASGGAGSRALLELHGPSPIGPEFIEDAYGTLQAIRLDGTTTQVWTANPGWFTSAGDNGTVESGGNKPTDAFFRRDAWKSFAFWCCLELSEPVDASIWAYGNPGHGSEDGGFGCSLVASGSVRFQYHNGLDVVPLSTTSVQTLHVGVEHLVGGYYFEDEGQVYIQSFVDGVEQPLDSVEAGGWTVHPQSGFGLFCRPTDSGTAARQLPVGVQVREMTFIRTPGDVRYAAAVLMRRRYDEMMAGNGQTGRL